MPQTADSDAEQQAVLLETIVLSAITASLRRAVFVRALQTQGLTRWLQIAQPELAAQHATADADLKLMLQTVDALQHGRAELVRWRLNDGPVKWGVHKVGGTLGFWPLYVGILVVTGALTAAAWWLTDTFGAAQKVKADAQMLRQKTIAALLDDAKTFRAQGRVQQADEIERMVGKATAAADGAEPGVLESLAQKLLGYGAVAAAGVGGLGILALVWMLSRSRNDAPKPKPIRFRSPVKLRSPVYR